MKKTMKIPTKLESTGLLLGLSAVYLMTSLLATAAGVEKKDEKGFSGRWSNGRIR